MATKKMGKGSKGPSGASAPFGGSRPGIKMGAHNNPASCNKGGKKK